MSTRTADAATAWWSLDEINRYLGVILRHHELAAGARGTAMQCCGKNTPTPLQD